MLVQIPRVLTAEQIQFVRTRLDAADAPWVDGRATAGHQGARVKHNQQIAESSPLAAELGDLILAALERHPLFISAVLPLRVYPPLFNRYDGGMQFGSHVDGSVRLLPGSGHKIRTDVSATLFLAAAESYDGGELLIEDTYGAHAVKLGAGDMVVYPASSLHRVAPVTRGTRVASFFWVQSMVRDDAQRTLLYDLDRSIQALNQQHAAHPALVELTGVYHNLLRMWADI
ncbi:MAG: Fe2+-dependent dioxygenase [Rudaea sp.]|nr:Fe2+-dependent dioxygenase [Rudaea sp.]